jgi:hypothetical protein
METREDQLLQAFRAMDDRSQLYVLRLAKSQAEDCPAPQMSHLKLVTDNFRSRAFRSAVGSAQNVTLSVISGSTE